MAMNNRGSFGVSFAGILLALAAISATAQVNLGSVAIAKSAKTTVTVTVLQPGTLGAISVLTQGAPGLDFIDAGGGTCAAGVVYAARATCTVEVAFQPKYAGARYGAIQLTDSSSAQNVMGTVYLQGTGMGGQLIFPLGYPPPTPSILCGPGSDPDSIAIDGRGYAFVTVYDNVVEYAPLDANCDNGTYFLRDFGAGGLAIDGGGNLYLASGGILKDTLLPNGSYVRSTIGSAVSQTVTVGVDGAGNVYATGFDSTTNAPAVFKETLQPDGTYLESTIGSGWVFPSGVAIDGNGNVYITDYESGFAAGNAYRETPTANGYVQSPVVTGYNWLTDVAVDGLGNVFLVDGDFDFMSVEGSGIHEETPQPNGSYVETVLPIVYNGSSPSSIVLDGAQNQYITDQYDDGAYKLNLSEPSLQLFPSNVLNLPGVGQFYYQTVSYGANDLVLANGGNEPLDIGTIIFPPNFSAMPPASYDCKPNMALAPGASCSIAIQFSPRAPIVPPATSLAINENLTFTATSLNKGTVFTVPLSGTEMIIPATPPVFSVPSGTYNTPVSLTLTAPTPNSTIYYKIGTTNPTTSSPKYTGPITVSSSETIVAIATAPGYLTSVHSFAKYTINAVIAPPVLSLAAGTYTTEQALEIADTTPGAVIYYTLNGATPTAASTRYTGPVTLTNTATFKAIAEAPGYQPSSIVSASYTFVAANPVITPVGGTYSSTQEVSITTATPTALLFYTTNGVTPSASATRYTGPITVASSMHIKAIAIQTGFTPSAVVEQDYVIK